MKSSFDLDSSTDRSLLDLQTCGRSVDLHLLVIDGDLDGSLVPRVLWHLPLLSLSVRWVADAGTIR